MLSKKIDTNRIFEHDKNIIMAKGGIIIGGVDEAGRGPLCGPVVVGAAIMDYDSVIDGIFDSKALTAKSRETLFGIITERAKSFFVSVIDEKIIDEINILQATKLAMKKAIEGLNIAPSLMLIDAVKGLDVLVETLPIIKGDQTSYAIAAGSILAKVTRDRIMDEYDKIYPEYGFKSNKGYGTKAHIEAIKKYGACPIHRKSFIKNFT